MTSGVALKSSRSPSRSFSELTSAVIGWILFFQWIYVNSQPDMLTAFVGAEYRSTVKFRMLLVPVVTTLTAVICFWSVGISLAIYLLLLPVYMFPGRLVGAQSPGLKAAS